jgi:lipoate-protein ligase A
MEERSAERGVVLITPPFQGTTNMEIDEALLAGATPDSPVVLRIYRWREPTLSLGHFQLVEDRGEVPGLGDVAYVRRKTGGGAILHDRELTYSLIIPARSAAEKGHSEKLYRSVHNAIAKGLQCMGWDAVLSETCTCSTASNPKLEPFLCFSRRSPVDLIVEQNKVLGSAQRRTKFGLLQHGSLLLRRSILTPSLPGLLDLPNGNQANLEDRSPSVGSLQTQDETEVWTKHLVLWLKLGVSQVLQCGWQPATMADFPTLEGMKAY